MKKITRIAALGLALLPAVAAAQVDLTNLEEAVGSLTGVINFLIPFFVGLAVLVFIYGLIKYVLQAGNAEARVEARGYIIYGIIGIAVMLGVFGLVRLITNTFGLDEDTSLTRDEIPSIEVQ